MNAKHTIAWPVLRALDSIEGVLSRLALKANAAYNKVWLWTQL